MTDKNRINRLFLSMLIIGSFITLFSVFQIDWAQNNRLIKLFSGQTVGKISFFDGILFRGSTGGLLGLIIGIIYLRTMKNITGGKIGKLAAVHFPVYFLWIYPLKIYTNGAFLINQIILAAIPVIVYLLAEILFLIEYTSIEFKVKYKDSLIVSSFLASTLAFFGPLQIFLTNPNEFYFIFYKLTFNLIPVLILLIFVISRILLLFPLKSGVFYKALGCVFAMALGFWIQGNAMVWNYGIIDNSKIQWSRYLLFGIIDSGVWLLLIVSVFFVKPGFLSKYVPNVSVFFILLQIVFTILFVVKEPGNNGKKESGFRRFTVDENVEFDFSAKSNAIILIIDESQSDIFQEILKTEPEYKSIFSGFTYFRNSSGTFPFTNPSVASILTGDYYDNSIPLQKYIEKSFLNHSILKTLKENNFEVDQYPVSPDNVYFDEKIVSNLKKRNQFSMLVKELAYLYDTALFRYVPHFLKQYVYNDANWLLYMQSQLLYTKSPFSIRKWPYPVKFSNDIVIFNPSVRFIYDMVLQSQAVKKENVFKFYHVDGMHVPLRIDENFRILSDPAYSREHYIGQMKAMLKITKIFLEQLKSLGIYDNSLIIIAGDHGSGRLPEMYINPSDRNIHASYNTPTFGFYKTRGIPLILAKRIGEKGDLKSSDAPVSLGDIPETLATELGINDRFPGRSIYNIKEDEKRIRYYRAFDYENPPGPEYLNPMTEYEINGYSWVDSSWKPSGRKFVPAGK